MMKIDHLDYLISKRKSAVIVCMLLIMSTMQAEAKTNRAIRVRTQAGISGSEILLGNIADLEGDLEFIGTAEKIVIGSAPMPGDEREFKRGQIVIRLKMYGINLKDVEFQCPRKVKVVGLHTDFTEKQLEKMTRDFIRSRSQWDPDSIRLSDFVGAPVRLAKGDVSTRFEVCNSDDLKGRVPVDISFYVNGVYSKKVRVSITASVLAPVAVAARKIERHSVIGREDVRIQITDITYLPKSIIKSPEELIGMRSRVRIKEGGLLKQDMFEKTPLVRRGDIVTIYVQSKSLRITVPGEVLENGCKGDVVRVCNLTSDNNVYGVVRDSKEIEVRY